MFSTIKKKFSKTFVKSSDEKKLSLRKFPNQKISESGITFRRSSFSVDSCSRPEDNQVVCLRASNNRRPGSNFNPTGSLLSSTVFVEHSVIPFNMSTSLAVTHSASSSNGDKNFSINSSSISTTTGLGTTLATSSQRTSALLDGPNRDSSILSMISSGSPDIVSSQLSDDGASSCQISPSGSDFLTTSLHKLKNNVDRPIKSAFHPPQRLQTKIDQDQAIKTRFCSPQHIANNSNISKFSSVNNKPNDAAKITNAPLARAEYINQLATQDSSDSGRSSTSQPVQSNQVSSSVDCNTNLSPSKRPLSTQLTKTINRISLNGSSPPPIPFHHNNARYNVSSPLASQNGDVVTQSSPNTYLEPSLVIASSSGSSSTHLQNRCVAGTIIHEENEDDSAVEAMRQIEQSDPSTLGIDQLDPVLASVVLQASSRTGTSAAELISSLAEVKRRPTDTRNRLRRLGGQQIVADGKNSSVSKRLSLPASINLPLHLRHKALNIFNDPMTRHERRKSLNEIGFGKIESYTKLEMLGRGTYATVFKGCSLLTDDLVALKEIRLEHQEGAPCTALREVSLLRCLKHCNIVTLHDIIYTNKILTLVFEYLDRDLKHYLEDCQGLMHENNVQLFLLQILRGLDYCHKRRILHRDLKPQNLLINQKGDLKLADFGLARAKSIPIKTYSNEVVTLWYRPPDVLLGCTEYSTNIDMWGVGCIFYEMATGWPLFPGTDTDEELRLIFKLLGSPTEESWPGISQHPQYSKIQNMGKCQGLNGLFVMAPRLNRRGHALLNRMLEFQGKDRITAKDSMKHSYFAHFADYSSGSQRLFPLEDICKLKDTDSIFDIPSLYLARNPINGTAVNSQTNQGIVLRHPRNASTKNLPYPVGYAHYRHSQIIQPTNNLNEHMVIKPQQTKSIKIPQDMSRSFDPYSGNGQNLNGLYYPGNRNSLHCTSEAMKSIPNQAHQIHMLNGVESNGLMKNSNGIAYQAMQGMKPPISTTEYITPHHGGIIPPPLPPHQNQSHNGMNGSAGYVAQHPHFAHHVPSSRPISNLYDSHPAYLTGATNPNNNYVMARSSYQPAGCIRNGISPVATAYPPPFQNTMLAKHNSDLPNQKSIFHPPARNLDNSDRRRSMLF